MLHLFNQVAGDGANLFIVIVAVAFGFVNALAFIDHRKTTEQQDERDKH